MVRSTRRLTTVLRIFTASTLLVAVGLFAVAGVAMLRMSALSRQARSTVARVVSSRYLDHNQVDYKYVVGGKTFTGTDHAGKGGNPNADSLRPGDTLRVMYSSSTPGTSCACDPAEDLRNDLIGIAGGSLVAGLVLTVLLLGLLPAAGLMTWNPFRIRRWAG